MSGALVQHADGGNFSGTSQTSIAATFTNPVTSGNNVKVWVGWGSTVATDFSTVDDDKTNSYTIVDKILAQGSEQSHGSANFVNLTNGAKTVTAHFAGAGVPFVTIIIEEWSGEDNSGTALNAHGGQRQLNPGTATDAITTGNFTTNVDGCTISGAVEANNSGTEAIGTGYTVADSNLTFFQISESKIQATQGAVAATFTDATNGGANTFMSLVMAFKPAATAVVTGSITPSIRYGHLSGMGPELRRMMPQQFTVPLPPAIETTQSPATLLRSGRGPGLGPPGRRLLQTFGDTFPTITETTQSPAVRLRGNSLGFGPSGRRFPQQFPPLPPTGITLALTGISATFAAGTLGVLHTQALIGSSATFTAGTLGVTHTEALTGKAATFISGNLGVTHTNALTGQKATFTPGIVSSALSVSLTGSKATFGAGTVTPVVGLFIALTGARATFSTGTVIAQAIQGVVTVVPNTIGGISQWTLQIPHIPQKKRVIFKRNLEDSDRSDIEDIAQMLKDSGLF